CQARREGYPAVAMKRSASFPTEVKDVGSSSVFTTWKVIAKNGGREEDRAVRLERWREAPRLGGESGHTGGRLTCCQLPGFQRRLPKGWQGFATSFVARKVLSTSVALSPVLSSVRTRRCKASTSCKCGIAIPRAVAPCTRPSLRRDGTLRH